MHISESRHTHQCRIVLHNAALQRITFQGFQDATLWCCCGVRQRHRSTTRTASSTHTCMLPYPKLVGSDVAPTASRADPPHTHHHPRTCIIIWQHPQHHTSNLDNLQTSRIFQAAAALTRPSTTSGAGGLMPVLESNLSPTGPPTPPYHVL